jgi:tRNA dimethylallyltransferase
MAAAERTVNTHETGLRVDQPVKLVVIVGETGSGKSALALSLAERYRGEIIAADSRTIYKHMDIGTAKPTRDEQARVPHHLIDICSPCENFNVSLYKNLSVQKINEISARGHVPFMVGGTGLYVDSVLYDYQFNDQVVPGLRQRLQNMDVEALREYLVQRQIELPQNSYNKRHLVRQIETSGRQAGRAALRPNTFVLGLQIDKQNLQQNLTVRIEQMIVNDLLGEVKKLSTKYGWECESMRSVGYKEWREFLAGEQSLEATKALILRNSMAYAKRQRTWFKRNKSIHWTTSAGEAEQLITQFLGH